MIRKLKCHGGGKYNLCEGYIRGGNSNGKGKTAAAGGSPCGVGCEGQRRAHGGSSRSVGRAGCRKLTLRNIPRYLRRQRCCDGKGNGLDEGRVCGILSVGFFLFFHSRF